MLSNNHILLTKLVTPAVPAQLLPRPRLLPPEKPPHMILVCAPAGYGKTTLIASWVNNSSTPVAWYSLDVADNDPIRFLGHFIGAIQGQFADFGQAYAAMLESSPPPSIVGLMPLIVNHLCSLPTKLCLILDDVDTVSDPAVQQAIAFLIENQPPQLQLILAGRTMPSFSLARMRAQRKLLEYRAADLRFTFEETGQFCNEVMNFDLPEAQLKTLAARTEGWIAGLQLAAVSLHNNPDKTAFIDNFAGDDRYITDFLLDEVLCSRPQQVQDFLLQTSLLDRFNAPLCDAVTGLDQSRAMIDELERANLFIFGLDHQRTWYRYHHLFMSLLQHRLRQDQPDMVKIVHRRASHWFSENKLIPEAIDHAFKAGDHALAFDLMEQNSSKLFAHGQISRALNWARQVPPAILAKRPVLSINCAWASYYMDDMPALERHITAVAECLKEFHEAPAGSKEHAMLAQVAMLRGCLYGVQGQVVNATSHMRQALAAFDPGRTLYQVAAVGLGLCYVVGGRLEEARALFEQNASITEARHSVLVPITAVLGLGRLHMLLGNLQTAKQLYENALCDCMKAGWQDFPACGILHIGLGKVHYEMNELASAEAQLLRGVEMTAAGMHLVNAWGHALLAQTRLALGATGRIFDAEREASLERYSGRFGMDVPPLSAAIAQVWLSQGRLDAVARWCQLAQLPLGGAPALGREAEYLVMARYFLGTQQFSDALALLTRLWEEAAVGKRISVMVEIRILQALALHAQGAAGEALSALEHGVELAEKTSIVRLFIDGGLPICEMLKKLARNTHSASHVHRLLEHFVNAVPAGDDDPVSVNVQELSKKEQRVLRYLAQGMSNQKIAEVLFVSPNTIKTHTRNIYSKLGVNNRVQAVEQLRKLGMS